MKRELAQLIAITAFRSSAEINNLIPLLKAHSDEAEYKTFARAIAMASAEIGQQVLNRIYSIYPDIQREIEQKIQTYGRAF